MGDRNVIQKESEFGSSPRKLFSNVLRYLFSHRDQLACVILSDYGFKYLIADRWQNLISIILTDIVNNLCYLLLLGPKQDSEGQIDVLEVSGTCLRTKESWLRSNFDVFGLVYERKLEMHSLSVNMILKSFQFVHNYYSVAWLNNENKSGT